MDNLRSAASLANIAMIYARSGHIYFVLNHLYINIPVL